MKYIHPFLPALLPATLAATLRKGVTPEENLQDHLDMFRHVLSGNDQFFVAANPDAIPITETYEDYMARKRLEDNKITIEILQLNEDSAGQTRASPAATKPRRSLDVASGLFIEEGEATDDEEPEEEFTILPVPEGRGLFTKPLDDILPPEVEVPHTKSEEEAPLSDAPEPDSGLGIPSPVSEDDNEDPPAQESPEDSGQPPHPTNSDIDKDIEENGEPKEEESQDPKERENEETREEETPQPTEDERQDPGEDSPFDGPESEDYIENQTLSALLVDGLKTLLGNITNETAVFEFPGLEQPSNTTSLVPTATPTSTSTAPTETLQKKKEPEIVTDPTLPAPHIEGKANLKAVLDLASKIRQSSSESTKHKSAPRRKTYIEKNTTAVIEQPTKVHLKDLRDETSRAESDTKSEKAVESRAEDKPHPKTRHSGKPSQQSLSEIRKIYFQSLERTHDEDLITYFNRIYPELEHLLGKKSSGESSQDTASLLLRLSEEIQKSEAAEPVPEVPTSPKLPTSQKSPDLSGVSAEPGFSIPEMSEGPGLTHIRESSELPEYPSIPSSTVVQGQNSEYGVPNDTGDGDSGRKSVQQFHEINGLAQNRSTSDSSEHKHLMDRITETLHSLNKETFFHNPFDHSVANEAASSAEIYPSIIGAVIFALFLILL